MPGTSLTHKIALPMFFPGRPLSQALPARPTTRQQAANRMVPHYIGLSEDTITFSRPQADHQIPEIIQVFPSPLPIRRAPVSEIANALFNQYGKHYGSILQEIRQGLAGQGAISGRVKSPASIGDKLLRQARQEGLTNITQPWAEAHILDGIGFRLTLRTGSQKEVDASVQNLAELLRTGRLELLQISDYHGPDSPSYLSLENLGTLLQAHAHSRKHGDITPEPVKVVHQVPAAIKESGYTALQLKVRFSDGTPGEIQIRGPQVEKVATIEHLVYDIRKGKTLPGRNAASSRGVDRGKLETLIRTLSPAQAQNYLAYLAQYYHKARLLETGQTSDVTPILPDSLRKLSLLDLRHIHKASLE